MKKILASLVGLVFLTGPALAGSINDGQIKLLDDDLSNYVQFDTPSAVTSNRTCTLLDAVAMIPGSCVAGVKDGDFGDLTVSSGIWSLDADVVGAAELDFTDETTPSDGECIKYTTGGTNGSLTTGTCGSGGGGDLSSTDIDTSAEIAAIVTDETGTGALVFGTAPDITISATTEGNIETALDTLNNVSSVGAGLSATGLTLTGQSSGGSGTSLIVGYGGAGNIPGMNVNLPDTSKFTVQAESLAGTNDTVFQIFPAATSQWGYLEAWNAAGLAVGTGNTNPILFRVNRSDESLLNANGFFTSSDNAIGFNDDTSPRSSLSVDVALRRAVAGTLSIDGAASAPGGLRLLEDTDNGSNYIGFVAPSAVTSNATCTLNDSSTMIPYTCVDLAAGESTLEGFLDLADLQGDLALGTKTSGNYAAGDAEAGAALTGDSATAFFSSGTIEDARIDGSAEADEVLNSDKTDFTCSAGSCTLDADTVSANELDAAGVESELEAVLDLADLQGTISESKLALVSGLTFEGATADANETSVAVTDPTADRTVTIPDADSVTVQPFTCTGSDKISGIDANGVISCNVDAGGGGATLADGDYGDVTVSGTGTIFNIDAGVVGTNEIATDGVDSAEIAANAVGNSEMGDNAIGNAEMADNAIGNAEMADNAVGQAELADDAVGTAELDFINSDTDTDGDVIAIRPSGTGGTLESVAITSYESALEGVIDLADLQGDLALGTKTSGNYAAGDAEAGAALTGDSATAFFSSGTLEDARVDGSLEADEVNPTLGSQTQGNYVADVAAGLGLAVTGSAGEGWTPTLALSFADAGASPALSADQCEFTSNATTAGFLVCEGDTADASESRIAVTDPTGDRVFTLPDANSYPITDKDYGDLTVSASGQTWSLDADSVSANELDAAGVESELEAVLDVADLQGYSAVLTEAEAAAAYQPLDADLTSWAGVTRASGFDTFAGTSSSANLASLVTDETGSGALVFGTAPDLTISATTEGNIESAIDTLANLVSIQSLTVTLADAGADAILGWDDSAGAYENLTAAEVVAIITGADGSGSGLDADLLDGISSAGFLQDQADTVDAANLAADSVDSSEIAANAVGNSEMADNAIGNAELADDAVGSSELDFTDETTPTDGQCVMIETGGTAGSLTTGSCGGGGLADGDYGDITVGGTGTTLTVDADSIALGTDTTGNYVATITNGSGISGSSSTEGGTPTIALDINGLTEDTAPDQAADFASTYDASGAANKKVKLEKIGAGTQSMYVDGGAIWPASTSGCAATAVTLDTSTNTGPVCAFDGASDENGDFRLALPANVDTSASITAEVYWAPASGTGTVGWQIGCQALSNDDSISSGLGAYTYGGVSDTVTASGDFMVTGSITISPTGSWTAGDMLFCRLTRDANSTTFSDTSTVDAYPIGILFHFTTTKNNG